MPGKHKMYARLHRHKALSSMQIIALVFIGIITLGTVLLSLPAASRNGESVGVLSALFVATSATCVTGLTLFDTWSQWSGMGQTVVLCLIEIGGLGFMSAACFVLTLFHRKVSMRQRMVMAQALSLNDLEGAVRVQKWAIGGSVGFQLLGAAILTLRFFPKYGFVKALRWGVFHSVSAFCNAGFDIFGALEPGSSLILFAEDPVVILTLSFLVIVGGLGFFVWQDVVTRRRFSQMTVYSRLVLATTLGLLLGGAVIYGILEWNNPATLGGLSFGGKLLGAFFQSVTVRTAGFAGVDQGALTGASKGVSLVLMLIGGSSGSTAGGVKTVTFVVLLLFLAARSRGRTTVNVYKRSIPTDKVLDAMTIVSVVIALAMVGAVIVSAENGFSFTDSLFETVSALATVGLTTGITPQLGTVSKILIIVYMYFGRVGVLTLSIGFLSGNHAEERYHFAQTNLLIG